MSRELEIYIKRRADQSVVCLIFARKIRYTFKHILRNGKYRQEKTARILCNLSKKREGGL